MKELSIEEKAKRYDEAIESARKINSGEGIPAPRDWTICEVIFPELKESEDERMRKWITSYLDNKALNSGILQEKESIKKAIAWLEKQGEQKTAWSEEDEEYLDDIIRTLRNFVSTGGSEAKRYTEEEINWLKSKCKLKYY